MTAAKTTTDVSSPGRAFLGKIVDAARGRAAHLNAHTSFGALLREGERVPRRSLREALRASPPSFIAEVKKASPSKGVFVERLDHIRLTEAYQTGGASALSIVTEPEFFLGQNEWIGEIRDKTRLPILRKDFLVDPIQVAESAALGADAILLIARILTAEQMRGLAAAAAEARLEILYEAHDAADLDKIAQCAPAIVGVNARNLDTFVVNTDEFARLRPQLPSGVVAVAESGITDAKQVARVAQLGYDAFLVGESLIRSNDPSATLRSLRGEKAG